MAVCAGGLHGLALLAVGVSLDGIPLILAVSGVILSGGWCIARALLLPSKSIVSFSIMPDGSVTWVDRGGRMASAVIIRTGWVSEYLVILRFQGADAVREWLILLPDSAGREALRQLRVWLRWRPH